MVSNNTKVKSSVRLLRSKFNRDALEGTETREADENENSGRISENDVARW